MNPKIEPDRALIERRQAGYLERLKRLDRQAARHYMAVFNGLSRDKGLSPSVRQSIAAARDDAMAYPLVWELANTIETLVEARQLEDHPLVDQMCQLLEDINVAVNAWTHRRCLHHSRHMLAAYRMLRQAALAMSPN